MRRIILCLLAVGFACAPLMADEPKEAFRAEIARIFKLKAKAQASMDEGNSDMAVKGYREALDAQTRLLGADNPETMATMRLLAGVFEKREQWSEAAGLLESVFDAQRRGEGQATNDVVWAYVVAAIKSGQELAGWVDAPPKDLQRARELARRLRERSKPLEGVLKTENAPALGAHVIEACAEYRGGNPKQAIKVLEPAVNASANPFNCLGMALFHGKTGEKERSHDWFLAALEQMADGPSTDKDQHQLREKVASILYAGQSPLANMSPEKCVDVYDRLIAAQPRAADLYYRRGMNHLRMREWKKASDDFRKVVEIAPDSSWNWLARGVSSLQLSDIADYQKTCREMLGRYGKSKNKDDRHFVAHLVFLGPSSGLEASQLRDLERSYRGNTLDEEWEIVARYRLGRFEEARGAQATPNQGYGAVAAMAEHRLGNFSRAKEILADARRLAESKKDPNTKGWPITGNTPFSILEPEILIREAEQMINQGGKPAPTGK